MHWAITGQTAAEIIHHLANHSKDNMGLTNWRGVKVGKQDVLTANNLWRNAFTRKSFEGK
jgi:hypothetical protein